MTLREESMIALEAHATIPAAFRVERVVVVAPDTADPTRWTLREEPVDRPYVKDYDRIAGNSPMDWRTRFDTANWALLAAYADGRRVGGAIVVPDGSAFALLWDLRVRPEMRRSGIGAALFADAERWSTVRGWSGLRVETQNINVPACRFYERQGCVLESVDHQAYPDLPGEIQLNWCKHHARRG